jgi:peptidyl-prolyl cis-trans isomerase A (cyclophilin A)
MQITLMKIMQMTRKFILPILAGMIILLVTSCFSTKKMEKDERIQIENFIIANPDLNFELKESGLYYADVKVGTGVQPVTHDTAYIFYTAKYLSGTLIGTNAGTTDTLICPVKEGFLISGFDEAVSYMRVGGKSKFIVPSYLGYGENSVYFPAYTPILFEADLVRVKAGPGAK